MRLYAAIIGWELAFTLLDKLGKIGTNAAALLGISIHPS